MQVRRLWVPLILSMVALPMLPAMARAAAAPPDTAAADSTALAPKRPTIPITPFFIEGIDDTFLTATLTVPENRDKPGGRTIDLHIVIVPSLDRKDKGAPLFDIEGGPGIPATLGAAEYAASLRVHRQHRDVVLVDQRGTGQSNPLRCPELESASPLDDLFDPNAVTRCRDELSKIADLSHYTTMDAVRDLDDVRKALAYDTIDLCGISYGTQVVQVYMRQFPEHVRCAVMIGTVPLGEKFPLDHARNAEEIFQRVLDDCDGNADCGRAFPSLRREWTEVLDRFDMRPVFNIEYRDSVNGNRMVQLRRGPFSETLRTFLLTTTLQRRIPLLIHQAWTGNFQPFLELALAAHSGMIADGMYFSVVCPEGTTRIAPDEIDPACEGTFLGRYRVDRQIDACRAWGLAPAPETDFTPVTSTIPTLFLAGAMDCVTPVAWAQEVSSRLTNSLVLVVDHLGHFPEGLDHMECYEDVLEQFLTSGTIAGLDTGCFDTMTPPAFVTE
jgi:pimeloyl-ACP methyl ester carboxylesterase